MGEKHHGEGHRGRLRQRLNEGGPEALLDHEIVEGVLGLAIPRRDVKPIAKRLLDHFGGFAKLISADPKAIAKAGGISETSAMSLKIVQAAANRFLADRIRNQPMLASWTALIEYLRGDMGFEPHERVRALYLDTRNRLIANEVVSDGTVDESAVYVRNIIARALELKATALIIAHNHPSGDPTPSQQDIRLTRELAEAAKRLNITLHDHVIVGANDHASFKQLGLL